MEEEDYMQYYLDIGAIEVTGVEDSGEFLFRITELAETVAPELWKAHMEHVEDTMLDLFEKSLLEIEYDEDLNVNFKISEEGKKVARLVGLVEIEEAFKKED